MGKNPDPKWGFFPVGVLKTNRSVEKGIGARFDPGRVLRVYWNKKMDPGTSALQSI